MAKVLLVGNFRPSLPLARRLAKAGHLVVCGVDRPAPYLFASRYVHGCFLHARIDERPLIALEHIRTYLQTDREIDAVIPVSESAMRLISDHRDAAPPGVRLILPSAEVINACTDKAAMFDLCERIGAPLAPRRIVEDYAALTWAVEAVGRPCIIKPVDSPALMFGGKAVVLGPDDDLAVRVPEWPGEHPRLCVQRYVEGARHNVVFAARSGRLIGAVEFRAVRTDRADGTGYSTAVASVSPTPSVQAATEALLSALDYTGVGMLQFMIDAKTGECSFLELNPRLGGSSGAAEACGLPLCRLMLEIGLGAAIEPRAEPWGYPVGQRVVWTRGDAAGLAAELSRGALTPGAALGWAAAVIRDACGRHHLTLDPTDLAPTLLTYLHPLLGRLGVGRNLFMGRGTRSALERAGSQPIVKSWRGASPRAGAQRLRPSMSPVGAG